MKSAKTLISGPVPLCQVLEEEYISLHGPLPSNYPLDVDHELRLETIRGLIHELPKQRSALCLSGDGVRATTFALGVIQGLARHRLLDKFDYLSGVSGGASAGAWLTAWIHRKGLSDVQFKLAARTRLIIESEAEPVRYLREYRNHFNLRAVLFSNDAWNLALIYLRNLVLNWLMLFPLWAAILALPRLHLSLLQLIPPPAAIRLIVTVLGPLFFVTAFVLTIVYLVVPQESAERPDISPEWRNRWDRRFSEQTVFRALRPLAFLFPFLSSLSLAWLSAHAHQPLTGASRTWLNSLFAYSLVEGAVSYAVAWTCFIILFASRIEKWDLTRINSYTVVFAGLVFGFLKWLVIEILPPVSESGTAQGTVLLIHTCFAPPLLVLAFVLATSLVRLKRNSVTTDLDWIRRWHRLRTWLVIAAALWGLMTALIFWGPVILISVGRLAIPLAIILGLIALYTFRAHLTAAHFKRVAESLWSRSGSGKVVTLTAPILLCLLIVCISLCTSWLTRKAGALVESIRGTSVFAAQSSQGIDNSLLLDPSVHLAILYYSPYWLIASLMLALLLISFLVARTLDFNELSLHAEYRNRLVESFLAASRDEKNTSRPPPGTADFPMHDLCKSRPMPIFNIAIPVLRKYPWRKKRVESFTSSPLHMGSAVIGYREARSYGGRKGLTLGTAAAISSANEEIPYSYSAPTRLLMLLFNLRSGWWFGSPGPAGDTTFGQPRPKDPRQPLVADALGLDNEKSAYVNLISGEHFDQLGLYEMVLRRCRLIVVVDASVDPRFRFESLANAIRRVRIDLGVPIEFKDINVRPKSLQEGGNYCAVGLIRYPAVDRGARDGLLIHIKPALYGTESRDIVSYANDHPAFPHEADRQIYFSESQFESYRMLGSYIVDEICGPEFHSMDRSLDTKEPLDVFIERAQSHALRGRVTASEVASTEVPLAQFGTTVSPQLLANYEGYLCSRFVNRSRMVPLAAFSEPKRSGQQLDLVVWLQPTRQTEGFVESVSIRDGPDLAEVEFEVELDSETLLFDSRRKVLTVPVGACSDELSFSFSMASPAETHEVWLQLLQRRRLIQVLRVTLPGDSQRPGGKEEITSS